MNASGIVDLVPASLRREWSRLGWYPDRSVYDMFAGHAERHPDKPAVVFPNGGVSYAMLLDAARRLAASLRSRGIVEGDVVAYQLPNSWRSCAIDLAVAALGAVVAPLPPGRGRLDVESLLRRCQARAVIVPALKETPGRPRVSSSTSRLARRSDSSGMQESAGTLACPDSSPSGVLPQGGRSGGARHAEVDLCDLVESLRPTLLSLRVLVVDGGTRPGWHALDAMLDAPPIAAASLPKIDPDAPVRLLVSSGTESEPKLVAYSHNALLGGRGRFLQRLHPDGEGFRGLYLVPLGSSFGSTATFGVLSWLGGSIALLPRFETELAIDAIDKLRPTHLLGVPTMLQRMAADPLLARIDRSSLKAVVSGGSVIDEATIRRCVEAFGCGFISLYGSADGVNCHNTPDEPLDLVLRSLGRPNDSVCAIRIVDDAGHEVALGEVGEVTARGPLSPMQYVNAPELDRCYRDEEGWVLTGDLGRIDGDGCLVLTGRKKDIVIRGGANISTVQIETLATAHPDVVSAACVPVPDADLGQRVCLCLTLREGAERPSLAEFNAHLRERGLEVNKLPEYLRYCRQLPLSPAGKVDKKALAADVAGLGGAPGFRISV